MSRNVSTTADRAALQAGVERLARSIKELRNFDASAVKDRADSRLELMQRKANNVLGDLFGMGSPEYRKHAVPRLDAVLDTTFGDHYSADEFRDALRKGLDQAVASLAVARQLAADRADAAASPASAPAPALAPVPTPEPAATPAPVHMPQPEQAAAREPAPVPPTTPPIPPAMPSTSSSAPAPSIHPGRRVLVLGAGDDAAVHAVELLEQLGLEPAIIDAPSIDRLDAARDAAYAVVVGTSREPSLLLAVGFMLALLGRTRICLLGANTLDALNGAVSFPLDDSGIWRLLLAREMKKAGLDVDLNRAL